MTRDDLLAVFRVARLMRTEYLFPGRRGDFLQGTTVVNLFVEDSTRTRNSFQLAASRLGASVLNVAGGGSSLSKGESLLDMVRVIEAMQVDAVVLRHSSPGAPGWLAERCSSIFINAGDGPHEHPTQALLDTLTLYDCWNPDGDPESTGFEGKLVTIVGDISHSRVAISNIHALQKLGADVAVCGPPTFIPRGIEEMGVQVMTDVDDAIRRSDALNMLRMQHERHHGAYIPSLGEYRKLYGVDRYRLGAAGRSDMLVLHPGPVNRGVELDAETADSEHSRILTQVTNGVAVRMAVLAMLLRNDD